MLKKSTKSIIILKYNNVERVNYLFKSTSLLCSILIYSLINSWSIFLIRVRKDTCCVISRFVDNINERYHLPSPPLCPSILSPSLSLPNLHYSSLSSFSNFCPFPFIFIYASNRYLTEVQTLIILIWAR